MLVTTKLADRLYGGQSAAIGQTIKIHGLQFTVIGTFKEKVESFGQSELNAETVLIPATVLHNFIPVERIDPLYVQVKLPQQVEAVSVQVKEILESRHRAGASYKVDNLTGILNAARSISQVLTLVLILVSAIALPDVRRLGEAPSHEMVRLASTGGDEAWARPKLRLISMS